MKIRIKEETTHTIEIERSRFICYLNRCFSEEECREYIASIKKLHPEATHHCTAFITDNNMTQRTNDDGEPSKTAGKPMLEILLKNNICDICAVVVRYYGGVKLGAGGLIRAYGKSVSETLKQSTLLTVQDIDKYSISFSYDYINKIEYLFTDTIVLDRQYDELVTFTFLTNDKSIITKLSELTKGGYEPQYMETIEFE